MKGNDIDLSAEAAAIDGAPSEENMSTIDDALGTVETSVEETTTDTPARPGKKPAKKTAKKPAKKKPAASTPGAAGSPTSQDDEEQLPEDFLEKALATALEASLGALKRQGWSSPANQLMTEKDWCSAVAHTADVVFEKYFGKEAKKMGPELSLAFMVVPWLGTNLWKVINDRRKSRSTPGGNRLRENADDVRANKESTAGDPGRSNDGRQELQVVGSAG